MTSPGVRRRRTGTKKKDALGVRIERGASSDDYLFTDIFHGFDRIGAVKKIFGRRSLEVLSMTKVKIIQRDGYLRVMNETGDIQVSRPYLQTADERHFYLDLIHELVHVRQHHDGKELYDRTYSYVDRPTEIEAYTVAVAEARRIGMTEEEIVDYLKVEWVTDEEFRRMLKTLGVKS